MTKEKSWNTVLPRIIAGRLLISREIFPENILAYFEKIDILENQSILVDQ